MSEREPMTADDAEIFRRNVLRFFRWLRERPVQPRDTSDVDKIQRFTRDYLEFAK